MTPGTAASGPAAGAPSRPSPARAWCRAGASLQWLQAEEVDRGAVEGRGSDQERVLEVDHQLREVRCRPDVAHGGTPLERRDEPPARRGLVLREARSAGCG